MKTISSWIIANFEMILLVLTGILALLIDTEEESYLVTYFFMFVFVAFAGTKSPGVCGIFYLFCVLAFLIYCINPDVFSDEVSESAKEFFELISISRFKMWLIFIYSNLSGIFAAIFSWINFDEVCSRRLLFRNSNVSLFGIQSFYALNRFFGISTATFLSIFIIDYLIRF